MTEHHWYRCPWWSGGNCNCERMDAIIEHRDRFAVTRGILDSLEKEALGLLVMVMRDYRESGLDQRREVTDVLASIHEARAELNAADSDR